MTKNSKDRKVHKAHLTRSDLIDRLYEAASPHYPYPVVEQMVKTLLEHMSETLERGGRIEIRGFGSFRLNHRPPRRGRNPRTGEVLTLPATALPHFKPGKRLAQRVNAQRTAPAKARRSRAAVSKRRHPPA